MMNKVAISIIIPVFNSADSLERCLDSIIRQTFRNYEVIMIDDGSTDISGEICDSYSQKDCRFKVLHNLNKGVSSARNSGLNTVVGDYIAFVDSDDWIEHDMLEKMYNQAKSHDSDIVGCNFYIEKPFGKVNMEMTYTTKNDALENIIGDNWGVVWKHLIRKEFIDRNNIRFINGMSASEDYEFMIKCLCYANNYCHVSECLYHYSCVNRKKPSKDKKMEILKDQRLSVSLTTEFLKRRNLYENYKINLVLKQIHIKNLSSHFGLLNWQRCYPEIGEYIWSSKIHIPIMRRIIYTILELLGRILNN